MMSLTGKQVVVLGAGRSGMAAAQLASREGAKVSVWDSGEVRALSSFGEDVTVHWQASEASAVASDLVVISPGIPGESSFATAFRELTAEFIGETEFASRYYQGRIVGITGTNGKTTTTELVSRILAHGGLEGTPCGNYGMPLSEVVLHHSPPAVALELSSFQLETIKTLHPHVAIWLNFAPDHMDRYATVADYRAAKLRILENLLQDDVLVARAEEALPPSAARHVRFSTESPDHAWYSDGKAIRFDGEVLLDLESDTSLRGLHNAENIMAAMAAGMALGVPASLMKEALKGYVPPPHRCELIRTLDGVEYLNDSKATNLHALESALRSQPRPVVLIAGGKNKGLDYSPVLPLLKQKVIAAVTFGEIARPLANLFSQVVATEAVASLVDAVPVARSFAPRGSSVLLSPGTSSFDQFVSYEKRGDAFRDLVHQLT